MRLSNLLHVGLRKVVGNGELCKSLKRESMPRSEFQLYPSGMSWRKGYQDRKQKGQERDPEDKAGAKTGTEERASGEIQEVECS